jgi:hypothetical protein
MACTQSAGGSHRPAHNGDTCLSPSSKQPVGTTLGVACWQCLACPITRRKRIMEGLFSGDKEMLAQVAGMAAEVPHHGGCAGANQGCDSGGAGGGAALAPGAVCAPSLRGESCCGWQARVRLLQYFRISRVRIVWLPSSNRGNDKPTMRHHAGRDCFFTGPSGISAAWSGSARSSGLRSSIQGSSNRSSASGAHLDTQSHQASTGDAFARCPSSPLAHSPSSPLLVQALTGLGRRPSALGVPTGAGDTSTGAGAPGPPSPEAANGAAAARRADKLFKKISAERAAAAAAAASSSVAAPPTCLAAPSYAGSAAGSSGRAPSEGAGEGRPSADDLEVASVTTEAAEALDDREAGALRESQGAGRSHTTSCVAVCTVLAFGQLRWSLLHACHGSCPCMPTPLCCIPRRAAGSRLAAQQQRTTLPRPCHRPWPSSALRAPLGALAYPSLPWRRGGQRGWGRSAARCGVRPKAQGQRIPPTLDCRLPGKLLPVAGKVVGCFNSVPAAASGGATHASRKHMPPTAVTLVREIPLFPTPLL